MVEGGELTVFRLGDGGAIEEQKFSLYKCSIELLMLRFILQPHYCQTDVSGCYFRLSIMLYQRQL